MHDGSRNYQTFQSVYKYPQILTNTDKIFARKSEGLLEERAVKDSCCIKQ